MEKEIKCYNILKDYNIYNNNYNVLYNNFRKFSLKNHPDKNSDIISQDMF
jgi:hypothetical protein